MILIVFYPIVIVSAGANSFGVLAEAKFNELFLGAAVN